MGTIYRLLRGRGLLALAVVAAGVTASCAGGPGGTAALDSLAASGDKIAELEFAGRLAAGRGVSRDLPAAETVLDRLAQSDDPLLLTVVANQYLGAGPFPQKPELGASYLERAAAKHYPPAQASLAYLYMAGTGVAMDYDRARTLAKSAADAGSADGETALGMLYDNGWGVGLDAAAANKLFSQAAAKKAPLAMAYLGEAYRDGKGVTPDSVTSYAWFSLAAAYAQSLPERYAATRRRDELSLLMMPREMRVAEQLAASWTPGTDMAAKRAELAAADGKDDFDDIIFTGGSLANPRLVKAGAASRQDVPIVEKEMTDDIDVQPDGSRVTTYHSELQIMNEAAVSNFAQRPVYFDNARETAEVTEAYTLKADGRRLPVDPAKIYTQLVPGSPDLSMFDDQRQKVVIFPDVEAGDTLAMTVKYVSKPWIPGLFSLHLAFDRTLVQRDVRITVRAPKSMPLSTETHDLKFDKREEAGKVVYTWRYANLTPLPENNIALDIVDRAPRFFVSNYRSYDQLAKTYASIVDEKSVVTPAIQQMADQITAGITDRRKQAEAIYDWVSRHIRYVGIELGQGSLVPHDANTVLANHYGDCKDHSVLFVTLLKAKGIAGDVVLINYGNSFTLAAPPTFGSFNHAITWLPDFKLYADTTAGVAPFGTLPFGEYGKPVVHATTSGPALRRTPPLAPGLATIDVKTKAALASDGRITGDSETVATGPFAIGMRQNAISIRSTGAEQAAKYLLRSRGYEGKGELRFASPFDIAPSYQVTGHFEANARPELLSGNSFALPLGLGLGWVPGEDLAGPLNFIDLGGDEPTPCYSGKETEELSLELPEGKHVRELPKDTEIINKYLHYESKWSVSGRTVTMTRSFTTTIDRPVCIGNARRAAAKALNEIRGDYHAAVIALTSN